MQCSPLGYQVWVIAIYLLATNIKGVSSMKLHRDLGITQKAAWHLAHRIRKSWQFDIKHLTGPAEIDETYIGGKETNKHESKKLKKGRGTVGENSGDRIERPTYKDGRGQTIKSCKSRNNERFHIQSYPTMGHHLYG